MIRIRAKYPCGMEFTITTVSIISFIFSFVNEAKGSTMMHCPLHGKDCKTKARLREND